MNNQQKQNSEITENIQILQKQKLQEIGANLLSVRTKKGLDLDAIVSKTQITKKVLMAIEQGNIENLPEPFYTKALIKKYANVLGITDISDYTLVNIKPVNINSESKKKLELKKYLPEWKIPKLQLRSQHLYLLYLLLVGIAVKGIATVVDNPRIPNEPILSTETEIAKTTSTSITNNSSKNKPSQLVTQSNKAVADSVTVDVTVKERCWLKVVVDDEVEFEGILLEGDNRSWEGQKKITIVAGNAGGIVVTYNKGQGEILGEPGKVEEVTYTLN